MFCIRNKRDLSLFLVASVFVFITSWKFSLKCEVKESFLRFFLGQISIFEFFWQKFQNSKNLNNNFTSVKFSKSIRVYENIQIQCAYKSCDVNSLLRFLLKKLQLVLYCKYQTQTVPYQNQSIDRSFDKNSNKFYVKINDFLIKFSNLIEVL